MVLRDDAFAGRARVLGGARYLVYAELSDSLII